MANKKLTAAKKAKNDEFYTRFEDVNLEMQAYNDNDPNFLRGKVVLLPCDNPNESAFFNWMVIIVLNNLR